MAILPPVTQTFTVDAAAFLDGIDAMLESVDKLAESLNLVVDANTRLSGSNDELAGSEDAVKGTFTDVVGAIRAQGEAVDSLVGEYDALMGSIDEVIAQDDALIASMDEVAGTSETTGASLAGFGAKSKLAFFAVAAAVGYSVVKAAEFQSKLTMLNTQAGVSKNQLAGLGQGVLRLAGQVGEGPSSLLDALYHVESSFQSVGITGPKALTLLKIAAEGAQMGHADLVDTTNALDATIVAGVPGISSYAQAMGVLNATVGSGDMTMQDLANAMGSGVMAVAKTYGQSIYQVGAALAVFGDNNIRGAKAATELRMSWQAVLDPLKTGDGYLNKIGLSATALGHTLTHQGMSAAIDQFITHLKASKVPMKEWGQYETDIFGKRAGVGIGILISQYDRLMSKFPDLKKSAHDFGSAWQQTQRTFSQQWHDMTASVDALVISFGEKLLPVATKVIGWLAKFFGWLEKNPEIAVFAGALLAVVGAMKMMEGLEAVGAAVAGSLSLIGDAASAATPEVGALDAALDANVIGLVLVAVVALAAGLYELYKHCKTVRDAVRDVANFFKTVWADAMKVAGAVVRWFVTGPLAFVKQQLAVFKAFWAQNGAEIEKIVDTIWKVISTYFKVYWDLIKGVCEAAFAVLTALFKAAWLVISTVVKVAWDVIATIVRTMIREVLDIISIVLDIIQGHWSQAWDHLKDLFRTAWDACASIIKTVLHGFVSIMMGLGKDLIEGLINGIKSMFGAVGGAMKDLAGGAVSVFKSAMKIFSPSKVMAELGVEVGRGLVVGLEGTVSEVKSAAEKLASVVQEAVGYGLISRQRGVSLSDYIQRDNTRLQHLATERADILKRIKTAETYASNTASAVTSWASLSNVASALPSGGGISGAGLLSGLQADLAQIRQFNSAIQKLSKLGLNKNLLNQIIQAGPTDGLQYAEALLDGPVSTIKSLNSTANQITAASTQIGKTAADAMYDSGKQAGKGFLSGLNAQAGAIEKEMRKIAQVMVRTIRKELGISSPSKVGMYHGEMFIRGIANGMTDNEHLLTTAAKRAAAAMSVNGKATAGSLAAAGGQTHVTVNLGGVHVPGGFIGDDSQFLAKLAPIMQKAILQLEGRNPIAQTSLPRRTR